MHALIALDLDGTLAADYRFIPEQVMEKLVHLSKEGWTLAFITGRPYKWAYDLLKSLTVPYYLACHNGAMILEMPLKKTLKKNYLQRSCLKQLEDLSRNERTDIVICEGYEEDRCFYRPQCLAPEIRQYLEKRFNKTGEKWEALSSFDELQCDQFASIKFFGTQKEMEYLASKIEKELSLNVPINRDPLDENFYLIQGTHPLVNKGQSVIDLKTLLNIEKVIAAGDDLNDLKMLEQADVKIAMQNGDERLKEIADIIAPPAQELGILKGLEEAIDRLRS